MRVAFRREQLPKGEEIMTSFVHIDYPSEHPGVVRAERLVQEVRHLAQHFDGARASATLLVAAIVAALLVAANQVIDTWSDGHLMAAWIVMWTVGFAALGLLTGPARRTAAGVRLGMRRWSVARKQAADDQKLWSIAQDDARVMADISRAMDAGAARDVKAQG
jgi:hypothetical protein